jgi:predicted PurR-regulated permease PerM
LSNTTSFISRYWRIILFIIAIIAIFWLVWSLLNILLPFIIGLILAYLLLPIIRWIEGKLPKPERLKGTKRILLILLLYLAFLAVIGLTLFYTIPLIVNSVNQFIDNLPDLIPELAERYQNFIDAIRRSIPPDLLEQLENYLSNIGSALGGAVSSGFAALISYFGSTFGLLLGLVALPVFLFFLLKDAEKLRSGFYSSFSPWLREHVQGLIEIINDVLGKYIRASVILGLVVGILVFIGLFVLQIPFAPALAFWAGVTELIPVVGPWIGAAAGVIVTLAVEPSKTIWVIILYFAVQLLENNVLVPRIHSQYLNLHPTIILILLVIGGQYGGIWGIILVVPVTALFIQLYRFFLRSIREESLRRE